MIRRRCRSALGRAARRAIGVCVAGCLALACAGPARAALVDTVVGAVDATVVSASDIALARALGLFGFTPSDAPIASADVDRYGTALLSVLEASRLGIGPTLTELDQAWTELETRFGDAAALHAWLEATTIDTVWARRALEAHLRWRTWQTLHEGLTIEMPGAPPHPPALGSDLVLRNLLPPRRTVPVPFAMPPRVRP
jgi:hypothetical protein